MLNITGKPIIIYGAGWNAEKLYYKMIEKKNTNNVHYIIDKKVKGKFHGIDIFPSLDKIQCTRIEDYLIIVATTWPVYIEISKKLNEYDLIEFQNYIWGDLVERKIVVNNMNCYKRVIENCLEMSKSFREEYVFYPLPPIHLNKEGRISNNLLKVADLVLSQDVKSDNKYGYFFSTEYLKSCISDSCREITIPNLVGYGKMFYPMLEEEALGYYMDQENGVFLFNRDKILDMAWNSVSTKRTTDIKKYMYAYKVDKSQIQKRFEKLMDSIEMRESCWDIKISDYIRDNYKKIRMFNDYAHPSVQLMREICRRLLLFLELEDVNVDIIEEDLFWIGMDMYTYPQIKDSLNIEWKEDKIRSRYHEGLMISVEEYIKEYFWISKGVVLED